MISKKYLLKTFPEINKIKKKSLREKLVELWLLAAKRGGWKKIHHIPFTLLIKTRKSLIKHTRLVTLMAIKVARTRNDLDLDLIIAGGIAHDVGKLLEYVERKGRIAKSECGKRVRHPVSGAALASEVGLPAGVVHIIAAHSIEGEKLVRSKEAIVIHHCDFVDFEISKLA